MKTDEALLWGGLALAGAVGVAIYRKEQASKAAGQAPLSPYPSVPSPTYKPPVMTSPGYTPPVVGAAPPPAVIVAPNAPPIVAAPAPPVGQSAAEANAAFAQSVAEGRQWQRDAFATGSADLLAKVQSGQVAPDSAQYRESFAYLANLTGGVATAGQEAAKLTAAGLPPPA